MTLKELIETNIEIGEFNITLRDGARGHMIDWIKIGSHVDHDRVYPESPRWKVINRIINRIETGDSWGVIIKEIPRELLGLKVDFWRLTKGFRIDNNLHLLYTLNVDLIAQDAAVLSTATEEEPQLPGQMRIEDFIDQGE